MEAPKGSTATATTVSASTDTGTKDMADANINRQSGLVCAYEKQIAGNIVDSGSFI